MEKMDRMVEEAFRVNIKRSLQEISKAINGDAKTSPNPLFRVEVVLTQQTPRSPAQVHRDRLYLSNLVMQWLLITLLTWWGDHYLTFRHQKHAFCDFKAKRINTISVSVWIFVLVTESCWPCVLHTAKRHYHTSSRGHSEHYNLYKSQLWQHCCVIQHSTLQLSSTEVYLD